jgi:hypothetical protein
MNILVQYLPGSYTFIKDTNCRILIEITAILLPLLSRLLCISLTCDSGMYNPPLYILLWDVLLVLSSERILICSSSTIFISRKGGLLGSYVSVLQGSSKMFLSRRLRLLITLVPGRVKPIDTFIFIPKYIINII